MLFLGFSLFLLASCEMDHRKPGYEFLPDMSQAIPYESFSPNPNTRDGKTLQPPVAGTIPMGFEPYPYPDDRKRAAKEWINPIKSRDQKVLMRGQQVYETFCLLCHGVMGKGDGPLIPKFPNPPSFTSKRTRALTDGEIYHVITMGSQQMASYASQIKPEDRWKVIHYIRVLQGESPEGGAVP